MDQRRFLLALVLMFALLFVYEQLFVQPYRRQPAPVPEAGQAPPPAQRPEAQPQPPESEAAVGLGAPTTADTPTVTVESDVLRATITTTGARLKSLELKDFRQTGARDSPLLDLVTPSQVLPMTAELGNGTNDAAVLYAASVPSLELHGPQDGEIVFTAKQPDGTVLEQR